MAHLLQHLRVGLLAPLLHLVARPQIQHLVRVGGAVRAEDVGVPLDHLVADGRDGIRDIELAVPAADLRLHHHLHQDVAQLVVEVIHIALVDRVDGLVGLLQHAGSQALVGLLPIPGTAARALEDAHDLHQLVKAEALQLHQIPLRRNQRAAAVVVALQAIQIVQWRAGHAAVAHQHQAARLVRVALHQLQLDLRGKLPAVQLPHQRIIHGREAEALPVGGLQHARRAVQMRQQRALHARPRNDLRPHAQRIQRVHAAVAHVIDGIDHVHVLRSLDHAFRSPAGVLVEVLDALIEFVQRLIGHALVREPLGAADAPGVQNHPSAAFERLCRCKGQLADLQAHAHNRNPVHIHHIQFVEIEAI